MHPTQNPAKDDLRMSWDSASCQQAHELGATKQLQEALELASMGGGGLELEGNSASIKSISDSIQSSMACCLSSNASALSVSGLRRQLSIRKNERKGDSDEPDAPLLLDWELAVGEGDVAVGGEESDQANDTSKGEFDKNFSIKPKPPPGRRRIQIPKSFFHPKQTSPTPTSTILVHAYSIPG